MVYEDDMCRLQYKLQYKASHTYIKQLKVFICVTSVADANGFVHVFSSLTFLSHMGISFVRTIFG